MKLVYYFLFTLIILFANSESNAQNFIWAKETKPAAWNKVAGIMDSHGNSYLATSYFDSIVIDTNTFRDSSAQRIFVAKYTPTGNFVSLIQNTGTGDADLVGMCIDRSNNIYVAGEFGGEITLGGFTIHGDSTTTSYFVMKMDTAGFVYWLKPFNNVSGSATTYDITITDLTCDKNDSLYICGLSGGLYDLDGISLSISNGILYFAKLNPVSGTAIWAKQALSFPNSTVYPEKILTDSNCNIILSGIFNGLYTVFNATDTLYPLPLSSSSFIAKYDQHGSFSWVVMPDSSGPVGFSNACVDNNNNIYAIGYNYGIGYYAKYTSSGSQKWFQNLNFNPIFICNSQNGNYLYSQSITDSFAYMGHTLNLSGGDILLKTDTGTGSLIWNTPPIDVQVETIFAGNNAVVQVCGQSNAMSHLGTNFFAFQGDFVSLICDSNYSPSTFNTIRGNIFNDTNLNCIKNAEAGISGFGVIAEPGPFYAVTDSIGNYSLKVGSGLFTVREITPSSAAFLDSQLCPSTVYSVSFTSTGNIDTGYNFPNKNSSCALLYINPATSSTYLICDTLHFTTVVVCNNGADTARNPTLHLHYPGYAITPISCSIAPYTYNAADSLMSITLSNLPPDSCVTITITDSVLCSSIFSLSDLNIQLHVTPNNNCYPIDTIYNYALIGVGYYPTLGIKSTNSNKDNVIIYPNPTKDKINIAGLSQINQLDVYDVLGKHIITKNSDISSQETIDLTGQPSGVYFIKIRNSKGSSTYRFLKY